MGGIEPARTYILEAIAAGKQVVTANKDLLAEDGRELLEASDAAGTDLLFEGKCRRCNSHYPSSEAKHGRGQYHRDYGYCKWYDQLYPDKDV